jgi:hypothetical protein
VTVIDLRLSLFRPVPSLVVSHTKAYCGGEAKTAQFRYVSDNMKGLR